MFFGKVSPTVLISYEDLHVSVSPNDVFGTLKTL